MRVPDTASRHRDGSAPWLCLAVVFSLALAWPGGARAQHGAASRPASRDALASRPAGQSEAIADPDDDDDFPPVGPGEGKVASSSGVGGSAEPKVQWAASALLRLAFDTWHEANARPRQAELREDVMAVTGRAFAHVYYQLRPWMRIKLGGQLYWRLTAERPRARGRTFLGFNGHQHRNDVEALLGDSYVDLSGSWIDLKLGVFTTVWGKNNLQNPNDMLSARDLRQGALITAEAARLPTPGVALDAYLKTFTFSAIWQPVFTPDRFDLFGSDFALFGPAAPQELRGFGNLLADVVDDSVEGPAQAALTQTRLPRPFADSSVGLKIARSLSGWDLALQYAYVFERTPIFRLRKDLALALLGALDADGSLSEAGKRTIGPMLLSAPLPVDSTYRRQHRAGIALAGGVGPLLISVDVAYASRVALPLGGALPFVAEGAWLSTMVQSKALSYTLGARYTYGDELLITLEWYHELYLDLLQEPAAERPELLVGGAQQGGLAMIARYSLRAPELTLQLLARAELFYGSLIITPELAYRINDALKIAGGVNLYEGNERTLGGLLDVNDQVYVELRGYL